MSCLCPPEKPRVAHGLCSGCYARARRAGELPPRAPAKASVTIRTPPAVLRLAQESAEARGESLSEWVAQAVLSRLEREAEGR